MRNRKQTIFLLIFAKGDFQGGTCFKKIGILPILPFYGFF